MVMLSVAIFNSILSSTYSRHTHMHTLTQPWENYQMQHTIKTQYADDRPIILFIQDPQWKILASNPTTIKS